MRLSREHTAAPHSIDAAVLKAVERMRGTSPEVPLPITPPRCVRAVVTSSSCRVQVVVFSCRVSHY